MNDYVFHSCFDAWFCHTVLKKKKSFFKNVLLGIYVVNF